MKEFSAALLEPFGLRARRVTRAFGAFVCDTGQGTVLVKTAPQTEGAIWFAHGAKEHLAAHGFGNTDRYVLSGSGFPWEEAEGERYTVRRWIRAEEAQLTDVGCAVQMAAVLGKMHRCAFEYEAWEGSRAINRCYEWPQKIYKSCHKLQGYGKSLRKNGKYTEFDLMVLSCLPQHLEQAEEAQCFFTGHVYAELAQRADQARMFGHGAYSDHTVLLGRSRSLITDFEQACYMIPAVDLIEFLHRALRKNDWSVSLGYRMLEAYDRWQPLSAAERQMIYAGLLFPARFSDICSEAYQMKRSWMPAAYRRKMEEVLRQMDMRKDFLDEVEHVLR